MQHLWHRTWLFIIALVLAAFFMSGLASHFYVHAQIDQAPIGAIVVPVLDLVALGLMVVALYSTYQRG